MEDGPTKRSESKLEAKPGQPPEVIPTSCLTLRLLSNTGQRCGRSCLWVAVSRTGGTACGHQRDDKFAALGFRLVKRTSASCGDFLEMAVDAPEAP